MTEARGQRGMKHKIYDSNSAQILRNFDEAGSHFAKLLNQSYLACGMNQTAGAVVGFTVVAAATVGMWLAQRWRTGRSVQAEWAARVALANTLHKGPGGVVHLRYSWLNNLASLELEGWEELTQLDVSYNQLTSLSMLPNTPISNLVYLDVSGNRKLHSLQSIQVLQHSLRFLYAARCQIGDVTALEGFPVLEVLDLERNTLTSFVQALPALQKLNLSGNLVTTLPDGISDSTSLIELNLQGLHLKSLPQNFSQLINLEKLNLRGNKLSNIGALEGLTNLRHLDATKPGNGISFSLCDLSGLINLTDLRMVGMRLSEIPQALLGFSSLFYLDLCQNSITSVPSSDTLLSKAVPWRRINLAFNSLTEFPVALLYLPALEHICVRKNVFEQPPQVELLDPSEALDYWRTQYNVVMTSSRRTSASSETLGSLISSEFLRNVGPTTEQTDAQEYIWFDLYSYRSEEKPAIPIPIATMEELGRELILDRIAGCIYGHALGDAIGLATEFMTKDMANFYHDIERGFDMKQYVVDQHRANFEPGDWTDDTDQAILILDNLVQNKGIFTPVAFGQSLKMWVNNGFPELNDEAGCGCGQHTYKVISHASFKSKPHVAAAQVWEQSERQSAPNGAVMRTSVLGCAQFWNRDRVVSEAISAAQVTHADPRCVASAVAVSVAISALIGSYPSSTFAERVDASLSAARLAAQPIIGACPPSQVDEFSHYFDATSTKTLSLAEGKSIGYTLKALGAGTYGLRQAQSESFETVITQIALEAGDADTNAAVAGAMIGSMVGFRALPAHWIAQLRHTTWLNTKIKSLMDLYNLNTEQ